MKLLSIKKIGNRQILQITHPYAYFFARYQCLCIDIAANYSPATTCLFSCNEYMRVRAVRCGPQT